MFVLYTWATQNARKISIMLEECKATYEIVPIDIEKDQQFSQSFKELNPNSKIPVLLDLELDEMTGKKVPIFESGSILLYIAGKLEMFLPQEMAERTKVINWLFWQTSGLGPVLGNFAHYAARLASDDTLLNDFLIKTRAKEQNSAAMERFYNESFRLLHVLNNALTDEPFVAGEVSISDFAIYPWIESTWDGFHLLNPDIEAIFPNIVRWMRTMSQRDGVAKGMAKLPWGANLEVSKETFAAISH